METSWQLIQRDNIQLLQVGNLLSEYTNKEVLKEVDGLMTQGFSNFVIDLSAVNYINSVGLNLLIIIKDRTEKRKGKIILAHASPTVIKLLEMTKLYSLFELADTVEEALNIFSDEKI